MIIYQKYKYHSNNNINTSMPQNPDKLFNLIYDIPSLAQSAVSLRLQAIKIKDTLRSRNESEIEKVCKENNRLMQLAKALPSVQIVEVFTKMLINGKMYEFLTKLSVPFFIYFRLIELLLHPRHYNEAICCVKFFHQSIKTAPQFVPKTIGHLLNRLIKNCAHSQYFKAGLLLLMRNPILAYQCGLLETFYTQAVDGSLTHERTVLVIDAIANLFLIAKFRCIILQCIDLIRVFAVFLNYDPTQPITQKLKKKAVAAEVIIERLLCSFGTMLYILSNRVLTMLLRAVMKYPSSQNKSFVLLALRRVLLRIFKKIMNYLTNYLSSWSRNERYSHKEVLNELTILKQILKQDGKELFAFLEKMDEDGVHKKDSLLKVGKLLLLLCFAEANEEKKSLFSRSVKVVLEQNEKDKQVMLEMNSFCSSQFNDRMNKDSLIEALRTLQLTEMGAIRTISKIRVGNKPIDLAIYSLIKDLEAWPEHSIPQVLLIEFYQLGIEVAWNVRWASKYLYFSTLMSTALRQIVNREPIYTLLLTVLNIPNGQIPLVFNQLRDIALVCEESPVLFLLVEFILLQVWDRISCSEDTKVELGRPCIKENQTLSVQSKKNVSEITSPHIPYMRKNNSQDHQFIQQLQRKGTNQNSQDRQQNQYQMPKLCKVSSEAIKSVHDLSQQQKHTTNHIHHQKQLTKKPKLVQKSLSLSNTVDHPIQVRIRPAKIQSSQQVFQSSRNLQRQFKANNKQAQEDINKDLKSSQIRNYKQKSGNFSLSRIKDQNNFFTLQTITFVQEIIYEEQQTQSQIKCSLVSAQKCCQLPKQKMQLALKKDLLSSENECPVSKDIKLLEEHSTNSKIEQQFDEKQPCVKEQQCSNEQISFKEYKLLEQHDAIKQQICGMQQTGVNKQTEPIMNEQRSKIKGRQIDALLGNLNGNRALIIEYVEQSARNMHNKVMVYYLLLNLNKFPRVFLRDSPLCRLQHAICRKGISKLVHMLVKAVEARCYENMEMRSESALEGHHEEIIFKSVMGQIYAMAAGKDKEMLVKGVVELLEQIPVGDRGVEEGVLGLRLESLKDVGWYGRVCYLLLRREAGFRVVPQQFLDGEMGKWLEQGMMRKYYQQAQTRRRYVDIQKYKNIVHLPWAINIDQHFHLCCATYSKTRSILFLKCDLHLRLPFELYFVGVFIGNEKVSGVSSKEDPEAWTLEEVRKFHSHHIEKNDSSKQFSMYKSNLKLKIRSVGSEYILQEIKVSLSLDQVRSPVKYPYNFIEVLASTAAGRSFLKKKAFKERCLQIIQIAVNATRDLSNQAIEETCGAMLGLETICDADSIEIYDSIIRLAPSGELKLQQTLLEVLNKLVNNDAVRRKIKENKMYVLFKNVHMGWICLYNIENNNKLFQKCSTDLYIKHYEAISHKLKKTYQDPYFLKIYKTINEGGALETSEEIGNELKNTINNKVNVTHRTVKNILDYTALVDVPLDILQSLLNIIKDYLNKGTVEHDFPLGIPLP